MLKHAGHRVGRRRPAPGYVFPGHQRRAVVSTTIHHGTLAVRKTYHRTDDPSLARERFARDTLSARFPQIPPLLDSGPDYIVSPYYHDRLRYNRRGLRLFPLRYAREAADFLEALYEAGYTMLDAHPENVVIDTREGLKCIDCEFLHAYGPSRPPSFEQSWDIVGVPAGFTGDLPSSGATTWERHWQPYVGLSLQELRHDPPALQHLKRARHWLLRFSRRWFARRLRRRGSEEPSTSGL